MSEQSWHNVRGFELVILSAILLIFGVSTMVRARIKSQSWRIGWPPPGGLIGGLFLISLAIVLAERAAFRLSFIRYIPPDWLATVFLALPCITGVWTFARWLTPQGLDGPAPWDGETERRSNRERRENGHWRPAA